MIRACLRLCLALVACFATLTHAQAPDRIVFGTNWLAEAEHGGYYQALAEGTYRKYGLDVVLKMGGPQINPLQLLAADQLDVAMGDDLQTLGAIDQGLPITTIGATFQKNPTVIIAHPGVKSLSDLKAKPIAIGAASNTTFWPWLKQKYGFTDDQKRPYGFSVQPFLADPNLSQQGFVTSEPFSIEKGGIKPVVFLLADLGYPPYSESLVVKRSTLAKRADALKRFLRASAEGWKSYLANPAPAFALIKRDNPEMTDALIRQAIGKLKAYGIALSGDATTLGLGTMTDARWKLFFDTMVADGLYPKTLDYKTAYDLRFVRAMPMNFQ